MNEKDAEREALNQARARRVNERIAASSLGSGGRLDGEVARIACECGDASCAEQVAISYPEYERVRSDPTHFAVVPGHEERGPDAVVERCEGYVVVRKVGARAADVARETAPRRSR